MSDATKIPFEPIAMPPLGPMPPLPPLADAARPAFSRSAPPPEPTPTSTILPPTRKPVPPDDDAVPLTKFLPAGIAPETPEPPPSEVPAAGPRPSWLRRKRWKLAAGVVSVGAAGYGLHEILPNLKPDPSAPRPAEAAKPTAMPTLTPISTPTPKVAEERGHDLPKPQVNFERHEEPARLPILSRVEEIQPVQQTGGVTALPVPSMPVQIQTPAPSIVPVVEPSPPTIIPSVVPETPKTLALPPVAPPEPAIKPLDLPTAPVALPTPALPTPAPLPAISSPPALAPLPVAPLPVEPTPAPLPAGLPPAPVELPKPVEQFKPLEEIKPVEQPKPVELKPVAQPKPVELKPVAQPNPVEVPAPLPVPAASTVAAVPLVPDKPKPTAPASPAEPKTDYDVDLHRVKGAETYATISEKYYGNAQYAAALRAYNRGAEVGQLREVQVPPTFVIRKLAPQPAGGVVPAGTGLPTTTEDRWGGIADPKGNPPAAADGRFETYRVPRPGMTMRDVAKAVYGSEREWAKVDNKRNIKFRPDEELPVGAELQVPVERDTWR